MKPNNADELLKCKIDYVGRWLTEHGDHVHAGLRPIYIYCSECGMVSTVMWNYCPNCGARMENPAVVERERSSE